MKDMYSFHEGEEDLNKYYDEVKKVYLKVFKRLGLDAKLVAASGGIFSKYSHEFQVLTDIGEDTIYYCDKCDYAVNKEITEVKEGDKCPECDGKIKVGRGVEVGNIFPLKTKWSDPMKAGFVDKEGKEQNYVMGCYGIGLTRALATAVEIYYDSAKNKMNWPKEIAPFEVHLISLGKNEDAEKLYKSLMEKGIEILYDDREISAGEKFAEADLIGCPTRIILSAKSLEAGGAELIRQGETQILSTENLLDKILS
jgi:prolyl-tRNA synthetase